MATRGKKIDTWQIRVDRQIYPVDVYLQKGASSVSFSARYKVEGVEYVKNHDNCNSLRHKVEEAIQKLTGLVWHKVLYVRLSGDYQIFNQDNEFRDDIDNALVVTVEPYEVAERADGVKVRRGHEDGYVSTGWPATGPFQGGTFDRHHGQGVAATIADTAEHRAALNQVFEAMHTLTTKLRGLFDPERLEHTLLQIASQGLNLLPPPPTKEKGSAHAQATPRP